MTTSQGFDLQKHYKDRGLMPGFFTWLDGEKVPVEMVCGLDICRDSVVVGIDEKGWTIRKPLDEINITVHLKNGDKKLKAFTQKELSGDTQ